jgi:integrase
MASVKYRIKKERNNASIYLRLSVSRDEVYEKKTGLSIEFDQWSNSKGYPKQNLANAKKTHNRLKRLESYILSQVNETKAEGNELSSKWLQHQIDLFFDRITVSKQSDLLTDAINHIIITAGQRKSQTKGLGLSKSRINDYKALARLIHEFQGSEKLKVKHINKAKGEQFLNWLLNEMHYSKGYALRHMDNLKSVCRDAATHGIEISPQLKTITGGKVKNEFIIYLTPDELEKISLAQMPHDYQKNAKKWLLLGCELGQRGGDLLKLSSDNIKTRSGLTLIELTQQKTKREISIPLSPLAESIIETGFPRSISTQKFNDYIKQVCKIAGVDTPTKGKKRNPKTNRNETGKYPKYELVTSHICRRSFATNNYGDMPTPLIMQVTGHSSEKSLLQYIGKSGLDYTQQIADYWALKEAKSKAKDSKSNLKIAR